MSRGRMMWAAFALTLAIVAGSTPRIVGDGGEYLAMALNFAHGHGPSLKPSELPRLHRGVSDADRGLENWKMESASVAGEDGRRDFLHFWFYPLLASPGVWLTERLGISPIWAFTATNVLLLGAALFLALPRVGPAFSLLLFLGPVIWFIDKAHTESFTFALLTIAMLTMRERPWLAMPAIALASLQNPPILAALVIAGSAAVIRDWRRLADRRFLIGAAAAAAIAVLHPAYNYIRHGTPSLLLKATNPGWPTPAEIAAVPLDAQIGLLPAFPLLAVVIVLAALGLRHRWRDLLSIELAAAIATGVVFLVAFAKTPNMHHGATPSFSRYGLWLVPLTVPLLAAHFATRARPTRTMWSLAAASATVSLFAFHPAVPQNRYEPNVWARLLWWSHPGWSNPIPEIFIETLAGQEIRRTPVATPTCSKVLLSVQPNQGVWPPPCYPAELPARCSNLRSLCYANRTGDGYDFVRAPGRRFGEFRVEADGVWPDEVVTSVRMLYDEWHWQSLRPSFEPPDIVRSSDGMNITALVGDSRVVLILHVRGPASMFLRLPVASAAGEFIDLKSGTSVASFTREDANDLWQLDVPPGYPWLALRLDYRQ